MVKWFAMDDRLRRKFRMIEAPCITPQGIFDPRGSPIFSNRSLTSQQATGNALAPEFKKSTRSWYGSQAGTHCCFLL